MCSPVNVSVGPPRTGLSSPERLPVARRAARVLAAQSRLGWALPARRPSRAAVGRRAEHSGALLPEREQEELLSWFDYS